MIKPLLSLKNSLLLNKAVFDFWFQSTHDYANLVNEWLTSAVGLSQAIKGCTRLASASDKVYQFLVHGRWFSPGTPASSTTKTGRHDIAEILLKVTLKHQKSNQINLYILCIFF